MVQNVMTTAFKNATSLSESIELLEAFKLMACRTSIIQCVGRMTQMVMFTYSSVYLPISKNLFMFNKF